MILIDIIKRLNISVLLFDISKANEIRAYEMRYSWDLRQKRMTNIHFSNYISKSISFRTE